MKLSMDYDEDEDYEEEYDDSEPEEEGRAVKPVTAILALLVLVALSAIICAVLWNVTHSGRGKDHTERIPAKQTEEAEPGGEPAPGAVPEESGEPASGASPEESGEPASGASSEESGEPAPGASPEESGEPAPGAAPEESGEPAPGAAPGESGEPEPGDSASGAAGQEAMVFAECAETVTPKEVINLRSVPSTGQADTIVAQARNGEILTRTGINGDTGWSRVEYNGQVLYAVSNYLTVDLAYQPPAAATDSNSVSTKDGRTIVFTDCDDEVSPKIYVNLRLEPSTSEGNDTVHCRLEYGEVVHRTGISEDSGWSRVEYDGAVLYVVTSYIYVVEDSQ